jgi:hypothetical protein
MASGCGLVSGANVTVNVHGITDPTYYQGVDTGSGWYNITIDTSALEYSYDTWYNVTINASREFYPERNNTFTYSFYIASEPQLTNANIDQFPSGPWGAPFNFTVDVADTDNNNVTVYLWRRLQGESEWTLMGSELCYTC